MEKYKFLEGYDGFLNGKLTINKTLKPEFKSLLDHYMAKVDDINKGKLKTDYKEAAFIGAGNPDAEILFIGKEMGIDTEKHKDQFDATVSENIDKWDKQRNGYNIVSGIQENYWDFFSPWFPYYLQNNLIRKEYEIEEDNPTKKTNNNGTSRTEYFYQRIISGIYEIPEEEKQYLTLHMYAFQSELSTATARISAEVNPAERKQSIKNRKVLWQTPFFQGFPITILGIGPSKKYIFPGSDREDVINIEKDFKVKHEKPTIDIGKKFINVHFSEDGTRMLLHTSHLSASSNELIEEICVLCRKFLEGRSTNQGKENVLKYLQKK